MIISFRVSFDKIIDVPLKIRPMRSSSESNHSFQYKKPRLLIEYFEQTISERFVVVVVVVLYECLQILIVFVSIECVFYLEQRTRKK